MRYILNDSGFIETVSFSCEIECNNKTCTEYTGTVPTGYETLAEWNENANINAYKIVDGNLTYDSEEDARLQSLWASQGTGNINGIVENGSNSNGEYTKFADGTLICTGTATVDFVPAGNGADIIVALPHNFINQEYRISLQKRFCGAYYSFVIENITFKNLHDFGIGCWNNWANNDSGTINWDYTAIGKWK